VHSTKPNNSRPHKTPTKNNKRNKKNRS